MLLGYKPVQHVTVLNTVGSCNTMVLYYIIIQGDQKVTVHLMITIQEVTSNVQSVPHWSLDIY